MFAGNKYHCLLNFVNFLMNLERTYKFMILCVFDFFWLENPLFHGCLNIFLCWKQCSFVEHRNYKIVYRRYASLFFLVGVDNDEVHTISFFSLLLSWYLKVKHDIVMCLRVLIQLSIEFSCSFLVQNTEIRKRIIIARFISYLK